MAFLRSSTNAGAKTAHANLSAPAVQDWFAKYVTLSGKPYTLDLDQARAVADAHKNTLVTARAGSGKTRVIVAKIAFLIAHGYATPNEIATFMFNRTAAAEVNQRISEVEINSQTLLEISGQTSITIASTFHKFALDLVKLTGAHPQIITDLEHEQIISQALTKSFASASRKIPPRERAELRQLVSNFIVRAGQKFSGKSGLSQLHGAVEQYCQKYAQDQTAQTKIYTHRFALAAFEEYLRLISLSDPKSAQAEIKTAREQTPQRFDFNLLLAHATELLYQCHTDPTGALASLYQRIAPLKYLLIDEYQDFSDLFFELIKALRTVCPAAHLFSVGDDWQAINRFAGSDVSYFIDFATYFPEDAINIPLLTNYRSNRAIVENANDYMLKHYDQNASRAVPFSRQTGKVLRLNPSRIRFDATDIREDALGDGRYQLALVRAIFGCPKDPKTFEPKILRWLSSPSTIAAAKLLKTTCKIIKKRRQADILLLHRHNFTSLADVTLTGFLSALKIVLIEQCILSEAAFEAQVRCMTMHKSKGLEADTVILLEFDREIVASEHPHATTFELFGDSRAAEKADQHRLLYVALTRAKRRLYILSSDQSPIA